MRRYFVPLLAIWMANFFWPANIVKALTEEEKKRIFLKAREEMRTVREPTPRPTSRPKPKPAQRPSPTRKPPTPTPRPTVKRITPTAALTERPEERRVTTPTKKPFLKATPTPERRSAQPSKKAPILIQKSGLAEEQGFSPPPPRGFWGGTRYRYLTRTIRAEIDRPGVKRGRWQFIIVHNSGSRQGNAKIFEHYHRKVRKMPNGLAYHFVIGNGRSSGDGEIEIGNRWRRQINGGHVHSDYLNNIAIGICLVGDYNRDLPTKAQLEALDELIRYLRLRVGKNKGKFAAVRVHKEMNPPRWATDCPGDRFPYRWLKGRFK